MPRRRDMKWPGRWPCTPWASCTTPWRSKKSGPVPAAEPKAMVYYQAAMLAYPKNFMAANDLGVLLARCGNYSDARTMLEHSLSLCPQSATWHNLAVVYGQLGQTVLARRADQQAAIAPAGRDCTAEDIAGNGQQFRPMGRSADVCADVDQRAKHARRDPAGHRASGGAVGRARSLAACAGDRKAAQRPVGGRTNVLGIAGIPTISEAVQP